MRGAVQQAGIVTLMGLGLLPFLLRPSVAKPPGTLESVRAECSSPPLWAPSYQSMPDAVQRTPPGWTMWARSGLSADVCTPGSLTLELTGQSARGAPVLQVLLDDTLLTTKTVDGPASIRVQVPRPGRVTLLYLNFFYAAQVRRVEVSALRMNNSSCRFLTDVKVPAGTSDAWAAPAGLLDLISGRDVQINPCQAGELSFKALGQLAQGVPVLQVRQEGKILLEQGMSEMAQQFRVQVRKAPVQMRLINPFAKLEGHRYLILRSLKWAART